MLQMWFIARGNGLGAGALPEGGGAGDQAAVMMDAFSAMGSAWSELEPKKGDRE